MLTHRQPPSVWCITANGACSMPATPTGGSWPPAGVGAQHEPPGGQVLRQRGHGKLLEQPQAGAAPQRLGYQSPVDFEQQLN